MKALLLSVGVFALGGVLFGQVPVPDALMKARTAYLVSIDADIKHLDELAVEL